MSKFNKDLWDYYGEETAYFSVVTEDKFRKENLNQASLDEFFASGEEYVNNIWQIVESNFQTGFRPKKAIDFGCGVGRLTIPLAKRCEEILGIDVSEKMLKETSANCEKRGITNISLEKSDDTLSRISGKYDFVHSFIVIQHIKPSVGENIFKRLIDVLNDGGIGVLQVKYVNPGSLSSRIRYFFYREFPIIYSLRNLISSSKKEPLIPVYTYDLNTIFRLLQEENCHKVTVRFSEHGHFGALLFFQKQKDLIF
jgi:SAM-dependent methyltransferase